MRTLKVFLFVPALLLAAACNKEKPADASLNTDLGLAAQARNGAAMDSISAIERARTDSAARMSAAARPAPAPARSTASTTTRRSTTRRSSSSGSSSGRSTSGNTTVAAEPRVEVHKNTKRDAAIGAAAGAVLGGVVGRGGVKGAVIGGAAGAILGGVIGNNVDVQKKKVP
jgi:YmgG-like glycine-zipper protein